MKRFINYLTPTKPKPPLDPRCPIRNDRISRTEKILNIKNVPNVGLREFINWPISFGPLHSLYILNRRLKRKLYRFLLRRPSMLVKVFDYQMHVPLNIGGIGYSLAGYGFRELDQRYILKKLVREGQTVLDIGANIGFYTAMYGQLMNHKGLIYAIEPDPRNILFLKQNVDLNNIEKIVSIENIALSNKDGILPFYQAKAANLSALSMSNLSREYLKTIHVKTHDFGKYLNNLNRQIDLMRMDVEGHEASIIASLVKSLEKNQLPKGPPRMIVFEPHSWEYGQSNDMKSALNALLQWGYQGRYLCTAREDIASLKPWGYNPSCIIHSVGRMHGVYENISNKDVPDLISKFPGITTVCLQFHSYSLCIISGFAVRTFVSVRGWILFGIINTSFWGLAIFFGGFYGEIGP